MSDVDNAFAIVARVIEGVGVVVTAVGVIVVLLRSAFRVGARPDAGRYERLRMELGQVILVGLEILIVGDIIRTITVSASLLSVLALGLIVVIRTLLSFALEIELAGTWPWRRARPGASPMGATRRSPAEGESDA